jgi:cytochrome c oxidase cbb3-type subunit 3
MSDRRDDFRGRTILPADLKLGRLALVFVALSLAFVMVLASAPLRPYFAEWRTQQSRYNELAAAAGSTPVSIGIKQIWKPQLGIADRCVTCHLGMGAAPAVGGDPLFREHPPVPHDPKQFGCTVCHGGQGRATTKEAAHGFVSHWDEQMLDKRDLSAGCATCHDVVPDASRPGIAHGLRLIESLDCLSCHKLEGRGRGDAPDLTAVGMRAFPDDWHARHLARHERRESPAWLTSYGPIAPGDLRSIQSVLETRVGMDRVVDARALAMERGCLGCHKLDGRGGDEGPALDGVGLKPVGDLSFRGVTGPETFTNYMRAHLVDPARVVAGSQMPALGYTSDEADLLTTFLVSLRRREMPLEFTPKERLLRRLDVGKPPAMTGERLFAAYCSACHGPNGEGRNYPETGVRFPRIGSPDFLEIASDEFIAKTLEVGRPGRRMPALAAPGATLSPEDVRALIAHLRRLPARSSVDAESSPPGAQLKLRPTDVASNGALSGNAAAGRIVYETVCAGCHGPKGEGKIGPALANPGFQQAATRAFVLSTVLRGREGTPMPAFSESRASYPRLTEADAADVAAFVDSGLK